MCDAHRWTADQEAEMLPRMLSIAGIALILPTMVAAQDGPQWYDGHVSLAAGVSVYDRSGAGTMGIYALRMDLPIYPSLLLEGGLSYARRGNQPRVGDVFIPGMQVHLQGPTGPLNPYVGIGAGLTVETRDGTEGDDVSFAPSFAAGVRAAITDGAGLRIEGRLHGVGANLRGVYSELTAGLSVAW